VIKKITVYIVIVRILEIFIIIESHVRYILHYNIMKSAHESFAKSTFRNVRAPRGTANVTEVINLNK